MLHDDRLAVLERENDDLREQIIRLEDALLGVKSLPIEWRLTSTEARVFGVLLSRPLATKEAIMAGVYRNLGKDEAEIKIVDVFICKVRKKLAAFGITIHTKWGEGYFLAPDTRQSLRTAA